MRVRTLILLCGLLGLVVPRTGAADSAAVARLKKSAEKAESRFNRRVAIARRSLLDAFDQACVQTRRRGSVSGTAGQQRVARLIEEREAFEREGELPNSDEMLWPTVQFVDIVRAESLPLRQAYHRLTNRLAQQGNFRGSAQASDQLSRILESHVPSRRLRGGESWRGSRHFRKGNTDFNLWISEVDGDNLKGTVRQNHGHEVMRVTGEVSGNLVSLDTTEVIRGDQRRLHFSGYLWNDRLVLGTSGIMTNGKRANDYVSLRQK